MESLLNITEKDRFQEIVEKTDRTSDEDFLVELFFRVMYNSQIDYMMDHGNVHNSASPKFKNVARSTSIRRGR